MSQRCVKNANVILDPQSAYELDTPIFGSVSQTISHHSTFGCNPTELYMQLVSAIVGPKLKS
jgi:hypothetical protein